MSAGTIWCNSSGFTLGPPPQDPEPAADTPEHACWRARGYTAMREQMNADIQARVLLGGRIEGTTGPWPGLVEEAWLALKAQKAVFLLGGFGGATRDVIGCASRGRSATANERMASGQSEPETDRRGVGSLGDGARPAASLLRPADSG